MTGRASDLSGAPAGRLARLLHQVEGVEAAAQLLAHDQVGERLVLGREAARSRSPSFAAAISSSARYGAGAAPCTLTSAKPLPRATAASQRLAAVDLRPLDRRPRP